MTARPRPVLVGIDPGKTVGIAIYVRGRFNALQLQVEDAVPWLSGWLLTMTEQETRVDLAMERFTRGSAAGHHTTAQGDADAVIARVQDLCDNRVQVWLQSAGEAKKTVTDRRLRQAGWYVPGRRHGMDAARHLGFRMLSLYPREYVRVMAGLTKDENRTAED